MTGQIGYFTKEELVMKAKRAGKSGGMRSKHIFRHREGDFGKSCLVYGFLYFSMVLCMPSMLLAMTKAFG
jgi:hypothetical protein